MICWVGVRSNPEKNSTTSETGSAQTPGRVRPGRWLNLAMQVAPGWAGPHLAAGQLLEQRGAVDQAALELGQQLVERDILRHVIGRERGRLQAVERIEQVLELALEPTTETRPATAAGTAAPQT